MRKKVIALTASVASICTSFLFLVQAQSSTVQKITDMESVVNSIEASEKTFSIKKRALQNHGAAYVAESKYYQFVLPESTEQPIQILSEDFDYHDNSNGAKNGFYSIG